MEPEFCRFHIKRNGHVLIIPVLGKRRQADPWAPRQPVSLLSKFQMTVRDPV